MRAIQGGPRYPGIVKTEFCMVWKSFPARLVVKSAKGFAICVCLIDFDINTLNPESLSPQRVVSLSKVPVEVEASIAKEFMKPNSIALNEFQLMFWAPLSSIAKPSFRMVLTSIFKP